MIDVTEKETDAGAIFGHLTLGQRQQLAALDAAYVDLLTPEVADKNDIEALADAVVKLYDEIAGGRPALENPD
ncbi:hypothetical protein [Rhizobium sp. Leaf262]|uniref:hypothetical protein n=1 Tax=Rhizobium sp. Leaf262 TaxID=1736312 RepID=UPI000715137B|nr:hypothetical protein [Rhizobium sp. Leaf262]KQO75296.1 hypothetical protein ASF29_12850 [Rhizobium sp. Leaf262]